MNYLFVFGKKYFAIRQPDNGKPSDPQSRLQKTSDLNSFLFFFMNILLNRYHDLAMNIRIIYQITIFSTVPKTENVVLAILPHLRRFTGYLLHLLCTIAL